MASGQAEKLQETTKKVFAFGRICWLKYWNYEISFKVFFDKQKIQVARTSDKRLSSYEIIRFEKKNMHFFHDLNFYEYNICFM